VKYLITGVGPHNKGSELMLLAAIQEVKRFDSDAALVVDPCCGPFDWRAKLGLRQLFDPQSSGALSRLRTQLFHAGYRERFGLELPEEIDVVLDASGFALGDQWNPEWIEARAQFFERFHRLKARIVLLPQAFGPFALDRVREGARRVLNTATLSFARDPESHRHCTEIHAAGTIRLARDFTNLVEGHTPRGWTNDPAHVAFVANRQMLKYDNGWSKGRYVRTLGEAIKRVRRAGYRPFVLVHETGDLELARTVAAAGNMPDDVVCDDDPLALKGILGSCAFSVGSRFHGLVSAMSQGVPCMATAWSHKYRQLFDDYGVGEWMDAWDSDERHWFARLEELLEPGARARLREILVTRSAMLIDEANHTWRLVAEAAR
jgi:colanic acid/amylovoran biosynthesis protein